MKTDEQWCEDNGVPKTARHGLLHNGYDTIALINGMLRPHGLRVRTKQRRFHGTGSYIWVEEYAKEEASQTEETI